MAYPVAADFRAPTLAEFCRGLVLTQAEASDPDVTAAVAAMAARVEAWCDDRFTSDTATYDLSGDGTATLYLPARCTAVSSVKTRDPLGTLTTQDTGVYRLVSSLDAAGAERLGPDATDYLEVVPSRYLAGVMSPSGAWPVGPEVVEVAGTFGWVTTPRDVSRVVALLVWDHFKALDPYRRSAQQWNTFDTQYVREEGGPSTMREANDIIAAYRRPSGALVA